MLNEHKCSYIHGFVCVSCQKRHRGLHAAKHAKL